MATNKKSKKKKQHKAPIVSLKPENLLVKKGRTMPIYECRAHEGWSERGNAQVSVARRMPNGNLVIGFYLIDIWCLGLKDTFFRANVSIVEYEGMMEHTSRDVEMQRVEPALAFNMIYAAVEYAEDLGFEPAKDFKTTQYLLPEPDDFEYIDIETGLNGKPCYYPGPDDKVEAILHKLNKNVGEGNYTFDSYGDPRIHGFGDEAGYGNMAEVKERFFPMKKVDKKLETLAGAEERNEFLMQVVIGVLALQLSDGSMDSLLEQYDEKGFIYDLLDEYEDALNEIREEDGLEPMEFDDEQSESNLGFIRLILGRFARHKSVDFMFEDKYRPMPPEYNPAQIAKLSPEELSDFMADHFTMMTEDEQAISNIKMMAFLTITEMFGEEVPAHTNLEMMQDIEKKVWEKLKADDEDNYFDENNEDFMQQFRATIAQVIDDFNNPDMEY